MKQMKKLISLRNEISNLRNDNNKLGVMNTHQELDKIQNYIKDLEHYKDTTVGLYAIDFDPKELIERFINSQSDACSLLCEDAERLIGDWHKFIDDKNYFKSPFFQLKSKKQPKLKRSIRGNVLVNQDDTDNFDSCNKNK